MRIVPSAGVHEPQRDCWLATHRMLVGGYPRTERARGYLEGVSATAGLGEDTGDVEASEADGVAALEVGSAE